MPRSAFAFVVVLGAALGLAVLALFTQPEPTSVDDLFSPHVTASTP